MSCKVKFTLSQPSGKSGGPPTSNAFPSVRLLLSSELSPLKGCDENPSVPCACGRSVHSFSGSSIACLQPQWRRQCPRHKIRMFFQKASCHLPIFRRIQRAGGVQPKRPAFYQFRRFYSEYRTANPANCQGYKAIYIEFPVYAEEFPDRNTVHRRGPDLRVLTALWAFARHADPRVHMSNPTGWLRRESSALFLYIGQKPGPRRVFCICSAMVKVFPPGAAQTSTTRSPASPPKTPRTTATKGPVHGTAPLEKPPNDDIEPATSTFCSPRNPCNGFCLYIFLPSADAVSIPHRPFVLFRRT